MILAKSQSDIKQIEELARKDIPKYRQAYSDRTAWRMACLSELAYLRFNPSIINHDKVVKLEKLLEDNIKLKNQFLKLVDTDYKEKIKLLKKLLKGKNIKLINELLKLADSFVYDYVEEKKTLEDELKQLNYELIKTFDNDGTQAILVEDESHIVLAFRGTEKNSIKDIKTDMKPMLKSCKTGGNINSGFSDAYQEVALEIEEALNEEKTKSKPLFITGHSSGGALATIAAKKITHTGGKSGCYTFGSPRVGDEEWITDIKTPLYRVVNAADCVTMLPPSSETITVCAWIAGFIPYIGKPVRKFLLSKFGGYLHGGDMRYMTACRTKNDYNDVELLYSVSFFYRLKALIVKKLPWKKALADHSISIYRKKLQIIAKRRNEARNPPP